LSLLVVDSGPSFFCLALVFRPVLEALPEILPLLPNFRCGGNPTAARPWRPHTPSTQTVFPSHFTPGPTTSPSAGPTPILVNFFAQARDHPESMSAFDRLRCDTSFLLPLVKLFDFPPKSPFPILLFKGTPVEMSMLKSRPFDFFYPRAVFDGVPKSFLFPLIEPFFCRQLRCV